MVVAYHTALRCYVCYGAIVFVMLLALLVAVGCCWLLLAAAVAVLDKVTVVVVCRVCSYGGYLGYWYRSVYTLRWGTTAMVQSSGFKKQPNSLTGLRMLVVDDTEWITLGISHCSCILVPVRGILVSLSRHTMDIQQQYFVVCNDSIHVTAILCVVPHLVYIISYHIPVPGIRYCALCIDRCSVLV